MDNSLQEFTSALLSVEWMPLTRVYKRTFICRVDTSLQEFTRVLLSVEWTLLYKGLQEYLYL